MILKIENPALESFAESAVPFSPELRPRFQIRRQDEPGHAADLAAGIEIRCHGRKPVRIRDNVVIGEDGDASGYFPGAAVMGPPEAGPVLAIYSHTYERTPERPWGPIHHVGIVYRVDGVGRRLRFEQDGSTDRCEWFPRDQLSAVPLVHLGEFGVGLAWPR